MRLLSIILRDFQVHPLLKLQLDPAVTTIKGPSDRGKSSILRALRWTCLNDFAGDAFIRTGADSTKVTLQIEDHRIGRGKGKIGNLYVFDGKKFRAFGQGVPDPIRKVLSLSEINFQGQHDSPFWFNETAGEVSRRLNAVIDLSVIDASLAYIASELRKAGDRRGLCEERLTEAKTALQELEPLRERVQEYERLASLSKQAKELQRRFEILSIILANVEEVQGRLKPPPEFKQIDTAFQEIQENIGQINALSFLIQRIGSAALALDAQREAAKAAEKQFREKTKGETCPLCGNRL